MGKDIKFTASNERKEIASIVAKQFSTKWIREHQQTYWKLIDDLESLTKKAEVRGAIKSLEKVAKLYRKKELQSEARRAISIGVFRELDQLKEIEQSLQESEGEG